MDGDIAARCPYLEWALAVSKIDERPIFGMRHEFFSHRILQNVIRFFPATFIMPQAMLKEITLPMDADGLSRPFFPFTDDQFDRFVRGWKRNQCMNVIRHDQKNMRPPKVMILTMPDGFK